MARIFVSYSHQDETWKDRLVKQLKVLATEGLEVWDDRRIAAGADWEAEIADAIAGCDIALLLISADFLTSRFILGREVPPLLQRRNEHAIRVVPVVLSPCAWTEIAWLRALQARPKDGKPLSGLADHDRDAALAELTRELATLARRLGPARVCGDALPPERIYIKLPAGAERFLGRAPELKGLDAAWAPGSGIAAVELIAPGGTGKTALAKRWLDARRATGWGGATRVFAWTFYSQGTGDDRQASEDHFLAAAIEFFAIDIAPSAHPADKGQALAERLCAGRTLLILDGCEPLQYPPGPMAGELRAPGLKTLLAHLAAAGHPGLCVLTSRERLRDLSEWVRGDFNPGGAVLRLDLGNLSDADGAALLHAGGATRAGEAAIAPDDPELLAASREVRGHALTLALLGRYLGRAKGGDIRQRDRIDPAHADRDARGHAARVVDAYETWLARAGETGAVPRARELAALRLLGFFDRPATPALLDALRAPPAIPGLTEALFEPSPARAGGGLLGWLRPRRRRARPIAEDDWTLALRNLEDCGLVQPDPRDGALDAHPLVREHLAAALAARLPDAWREGHRRLYARLKESAPTGRRDWTGSSRSTGRWPTGVWRGCTRRPAPRSIATASCAGRGTTASTAPASSGPSAPTWGPSPVSSPSPGPARPWI